MQGLAPAAWVALRGYLPASVVIVSACVVGFALAALADVGDDGAFVTDALYYAAWNTASGFACWWLLRLLGVRVTPAPPPGPPGPPQPV